MAILIVDDNPVNAKLADTVLRNAGYKTIIARNGREALDQLRYRPDVQLVVTDLMMPEMDGLQLIEHMSQVPLVSGTPVIMVSGRSDRETVMKARELGCNSFLVRPVQKYQLLEKVQELLKATPAVLREKREVIKGLGLDSMEYEDLLTEFSVQVQNVMPLLVLEKEQAGEDLSEEIQCALRDVSESAAVVGADFFATLYTQLTRGGATPLKRSMCDLLLQHLGDIDKLLPRNPTK